MADPTPAPKLIETWEALQALAPARLTPLGLPIAMLTKIYDLALTNAGMPSVVFYLNHADHPDLNPEPRVEEWSNRFAKWYYWLRGERYKVHTGVWLHWALAQGHIVVPEEWDAEGKTAEAIFRLLHDLREHRAILDVLQEQLKRGKILNFTRIVRSVLAWTPLDQDPTRRLAVTGGLIEVLVDHCITTLEADPTFERYEPLFEMVDELGRGWKDCKGGYNGTYMRFTVPEIIVSLAPYHEYGVPVWLRDDYDGDIKAKALARHETTWGILWQGMKAEIERYCAQEERWADPNSHSSLVPEVRQSFPRLKEGLMMVEIPMRSGKGVTYKHGHPISQVWVVATSRVVPHTPFNDQSVVTSSHKEAT